MVVFSQEKLSGNIGIERATMFPLMNVQHTETKEQNWKRRLFFLLATCRPDFKRSLIF